MAPVATLKRYIEPAALVRRRLRGHPKPRWRTAAMAFRDLGGTSILVREFRGRPLGYRMLASSGLVVARPEVFEARIGGKPVGIVGHCGWGGPQTAIMVEELAAVGVRRIIGYGACGSLLPDLPRGSQVVVDAALPTDGTSRAYARGVSRADPAMLRVAIREARALGIPLRVETAATVDALYRETPALVRRLRRAGAGVINMENTPLYAAARACGVKALWLGFVSDRLVGPKWEDWHGNLEDGSTTCARLCLAVAKALR